MEPSRITENPIQLIAQSTATKLITLKQKDHITNTPYVAIAGGAKSRMV